MAPNARRQDERLRATLGHRPQAPQRAARVKVARPTVDGRANVLPPTLLDRDGGAR